MLVRRARWHRCHGATELTTTHRAVPKRVAREAMPAHAVDSIARTRQTRRARYPHVAMPPPYSSAAPGCSIPLQPFVVSAQEEQNGTDHQGNESEATYDATSDGAGVVAAA